VNDETLQGLLAQLLQNTRSTLVPGSNCLPLPRLVEALANDSLTEVEKRHVADCPICRRTAANVCRAQMYRADAAGNLFDAATGQPLGDQELFAFPEPSEVANPLDPRVK
jgi:hypothetical protein